MGEVYRAKDTKLGRDVALKILPASLTTDAERVARFRREAQVLASLNHPHIAHIYGLDDANGTQFLVLELVDGESLDRRIARGPIPVDEALAIAKEIAAALEAAHEKGIIHRDLKPANIALTKDGEVKVLDFGLAKAVETTGSFDLANSPTITSPAMMTGIGTLLGTASYMSPEQARGKTVDKRADIWAFGCVLYEMLTGRRAFGGEDVAETTGAVIHKDPDWTRLPAATPAAVRTILHRSLEKDARKRLRDISGASLLLENPVVENPRRRQLPWIAVGAMTIVVAITLTSQWIRGRARVDPRPLVRLDVDLGSDVLLGSQYGTDVVISRDGNRLVWVSAGRLFTRRLDQSTAVDLGRGSIPSLSPDGQWVAFGLGNKLYKVSVTGGATITLAEGVLGASWGEDGRIVVAINGTLSIIPDAGGTPAPLTTLLESDPADGEHAWPQILPGDRAVVFTVRPKIGSFDDARIDVLSLRDGRRKTLLRGGTFGRYVADPNGDGYLLYVNKGTLFAVRFDLDRLETSGAPLPLLEGVGYSSTNGSAQFDVSQTGTLVYRGGYAADTLVTLHWLDANGKAQLLPPKPAGYTQPRISPDGSLIALTVAGGGGQDLWVYDWRRDNMKRLTFAAAGFTFHTWSRDGRYLVFTEGFNSTGMFWTRADGVGGPRPLTQSKTGHVPVAFSPDGTRLIFMEYQTGLFTAPVQNEEGGLRAGQPEMLLPMKRGFADVSPDGRWLAYSTNESGTDEIEVRAIPDNGSKWSISNGGAVLPIWSPNGRELFYRTSDQRIMVVDYTVKGSVFVADKPRLWSDRRLAAIVGRNLDIAPDGKRFIVTMPVDAPADQKALNHVTFLQNFSDEVRRRVAPPVEHR